MRICGSFPKGQVEKDLYYVVWSIKKDLIIMWFIYFILKGKVCMIHFRAGSRKECVYVILENKGRCAWATIILWAACVICADKNISFFFYSGPFAPSFALTATSTSMSGENDINRVIFECPISLALGRIETNFWRIVENLERVEKSPSPSQLIEVGQ